MSYIDKLNIKQYRIEFIEKCPCFRDSRLKDCIPQEVCPYLLHSLLPYYVTYKYGGDFQWTGKPGHVDVGCPNPYGRVIVCVVKEEEIFLVVKSLAGTCAMEQKKDMKVNLSLIFESICPLLYDVIFPWIKLGLDDCVELRCPGCRGKPGVRFVLKRDYENK